ncbi:hypothetical protein BGZ61DRAFT_479367 [Ilyonectria robusta]|uniref:uncharacterized protein n=1 Tax=Ilyonectria robusta TaxID=1079257 RepID=UPI001E8CEDCE|nr:uncharacterized protein BGZ61DRAFT_479367 [Ilyonectria robusta]KAH8686250.1 hypothetical protein BGZ61DRAFT_479367 [Ilyonectria robusta]
MGAGSRSPAQFRGRGSPIVSPWKHVVRSTLKHCKLLGGNIPFPITKTNDYAKAFVGAFSHPEDTENKVMLIESYRPTQLQILASAGEVLPGDWQVEYVDMDKNAETAEQKMFAGQFSISVVDPMVFKIMFTPGCGGQIDGTQNHLAGITRMTENELKEIIKPFA